MKATASRWEAGERARWGQTGEGTCGIPGTRGRPEHRRAGRPVGQAPVHRKADLLFSGSRC